MNERSQMSIIMSPLFIDLSTLPRKIQTKDEFTNIKRL